MIVSVIYHKVEDYSVWKQAFDGFAGFRKSMGEQSYSVGNVQNEPNTVYVINKWESQEALDAFLGSRELGEAMQSAGVLEKPNVLVLNEQEKG